MYTTHTNLLPLQRRYKHLLHRPLYWAYGRGNHQHITVDNRNPLNTGSRDPVTATVHANLPSTPIQKCVPTPHQRARWEKVDATRYRELAEPRLQTLLPTIQNLPATSIASRVNTILVQCAPEACPPPLTKRRNMKYHLSPHKYVNSLKKGKFLPYLVLQLLVLVLVLQWYCNGIAMAPDPMLHILCHLTNIALETGKLPDEYKLWSITPILKKTKPHRNPNNYQCITITSIIGKIVEKHMILHAKPHSGPSTESPTMWILTRMLTLVCYSD